MQPPGVVTASVLIFFGALALSFLGVYALWAHGNRKASSSPLTLSHAFSREIPETTPGLSARPSLTSGGRIVVIFAWIAGLIGVGVTWATLHGLLEGRLAQAHFPVSIALLIPGLLDLACLLQVWKLRRDYVLVKTGRLTIGKVVGYGSASGQSVLTCYDFPNAHGGVTRGRSVLSNYTAASPYLQTALGSGVEVFYLADEPERNGLKWSLCWEV